MNKASLFALEYRLELMTKADSLQALNSLHDFCRGFVFAFLTAQVITESEFDHVSQLVLSVVNAARDRICSKENESAQQLVKALFPEDFDDAESENVSASAAPSELQLCRMPVERRSVFLQTYRWTFPPLSPGWSPLLRKRPLVCGEGEVRLSSVQAAT